jgi:predicted PurR-regulated permease PerM
VSSSDRLREMPQAVVTAATAEEEEVLHASIRAGSVAQIVVAVVAVLGLIYFLKLVLITILASILLAFILDPLVNLLQRIKVSRPYGSLIASVLLLVVVLGLGYFFYNRALDFATELPKYSGKIRDTVGKIRSQTSKIEENTRSAVAPPADKGSRPVAVKVQQSTGVTGLVTEAGGTVLEVVLTISFVPFLIYFMLTWKDHARAASVRLFPKEHRLLAHRTLGRISNMIRSFILGNLLIGLFNTAVTVLVFWILGLKYFYFIGVISGFASLIPYLGIVVALLPPLAAGIGVLDKPGLTGVFLTVIGLHIISMNVLYPKVVGKRLRLNPLAVTLALLFWAWIWGAMGLILAIPILGATKIICDHIDSLRGLGEWLGE